MEVLVNGLVMDCNTIKDVEILATLIVANKIKLMIDGKVYKPVVQFEEEK